MRILRRRTGTRAGITLVEISVAVAIMGIVASTTLMAARAGVGAFENTSRNSDLESRLHRALERATYELIAVIETEMQPDPETDFGTSDLLYRSAVGLAGTQPLPGLFTRLRREYDPLEADDGIDNDGDGLVDEGLLVFVRDEGGAERRVVLASGVAELYEGEIANGLDDNGNDVRDEAGFNVHQDGDVLHIRLSLQKASEGRVVTRSLETSIRIRN